jgi:glycosyltransferase involved in cell wall biosynthesis
MSNPRSSKTSPSSRLAVADLAATRDISELRVAIVHDYLREFGGAERVLVALHDIFPDAPLYTAFVDRQALGSHWARFSGWVIHESWLTRIPGYRRWYSPLRIWAVSYFRSFDFSEYDVVISSSNAYFAKAVRVPASAVHLCYCHTPARSLYGYATTHTLHGSRFLKMIGSLINHILRVQDVRIAQDVDVFIANSQETQRRIAKFYRRGSIVIPPPVGWQQAESGDAASKAISPPDTAPKEYYLYVNRLEYAKHPELAVAACTELELPLIVVGRGSLESKLKAMAGPTVRFVGAVDDVELQQWYSGATALLYPVEDEDFGIVPVEAMQAGVPVIAHRSGGPLETITEGVSGCFFEELSVAGLKLAIHTAAGQKWNRPAIRQSVRQFAPAAFRRSILKAVRDAVQVGRVP